MRRFLHAVIITVCAVAILTGQARSQRPVELPTLPQVDITVLVENMAGGGPVLGEWGLSFLIEIDGRRILFDAGGGQTLLGNARFRVVQAGQAPEPKSTSAGNELISCVIRGHVTWLSVPVLEA
jgi:hypothetical protein